MFEEIHAPLKESGVGGKDFDSGMIDECAVERDKVGAISRVAVGIAKFGQHSFGGDQAKLRITGNHCRRFVKWFARIQQREEIKRIGKDCGHFFGSPLT